MAAKTLLLPFSRLYRVGIDTRNALYDRGAFRVHDLGARTISVGNLTTGGTGKTPLVARIAQLLLDEGEQVCILTRGYGRKEPGKRVVVADGSKILADAETGGDEPVELAFRLAGKAVIIADRDRVAAAEWAREKFGVTAFILDDGFQHRRAKRDLDILCVDATEAFVNAEMLPAGKLREPIAEAARADVFVLTRTDLIAEADSLAIAAQLQLLKPGAPLFRLATAISSITKLEDFLDERSRPDTDENRDLLASPFVFCGLGNPDNFVKMLERREYRVCGHQFFSDHRNYVQSDVDTVERLAKSKNATALLTTAKDAVKLAGLKFTMPVFVVEIEQEINDADAFKELITSF